MSDANFINTLWGQWAVVYFAFILLGISLLLLDPHLHLGSSPSYVVFQLTLSLALRVTWMLAQIRYSTSSYLLRTIDRLSIVVQFAAVSILVLKWSEAVTLQTATRQTTRRIFILLNIGLLVFTLGTGFTLEGTFLYYFNVIVLAASSLLLVLLTQVFGWLIISRFDGSSFNLLGGTRTGFAARKRKTAVVLAKVLICGTCLTICFLGRFVAYIVVVVRACDDYDDDDWGCSKVLRYFIIQVPDLVPFLTILLALTSLRSVASSVACCCELLGDSAAAGESPNSETPLLTVTPLASSGAGHTPGDKTEQAEAGGGQEDGHRSQKLNEEHAGTQAGVMVDVDMMEGGGGVVVEESEGYFSA